MSKNQTAESTQKKVQFARVFFSVLIFCTMCVYKKKKVFTVLSTKNGLKTLWKRKIELEQQKNTDWKRKHAGFGLTKKEFKCNIAEKL